MNHGKNARRQQRRYRDSCDFYRLHNDLIAWLRLRSKMRSASR